MCFVMECTWRSGSGVNEDWGQCDTMGAVRRGHMNTILFPLYSLWHHEDFS